MNRPRYVKAGEPWFDCHICGFSFPLSQGVRHYKMKKLVDVKCQDDLAQPDYAEQGWPKREEDSEPSPQRVIS